MGTAARPSYLQELSASLSFRTVVKPRVAAAEHISQFNEEARSPFVKKYKTIIHPGEITGGTGQIVRGIFRVTKSSEASASAPTTKKKRQKK
ncbi:WD-40 repeat-containing protein MSI5-like [Rosa chinensis]|uniref:WD-40 repeat-containing protein MSI5-like n=1 Tax=Rosa chinensis TaxID=74649 RepID=UPI001AD914C5|nr:WD-40 repeat-containing protein MSI5-like [Rosa chinensis]